MRPRVLCVDWGFRLLWLKKRAAEAALNLLFDDCN
jgi:hypothetical protein